MIQEVKNVDNWLAANGYSTIADVDIASADLFLNIAEQEKTEFAWPERAYEAYSETLKQKFQKIVEASGVVEIVWGLKTEGNRASVEESLDGLIKFVHRKQDQKTDSYLKLFTKSLMIIKFIRMGGAVPDIKITWNDLDAVSDEVRSVIFKNISSGIASLVEKAAMTPEQLYNFYKQMYPEITEDNLEDFMKGMSAMAEHNQWNGASYSEVIDFLGSPNGRQQNDQDIDDPEIISDNTGDDNQ